MPRWDRSLNDPESPYRQSMRLEDLPIPRVSDGPLDGEAAIWLYIGKLVLGLIIFGILATNAMYGLFELVDFLSGG